MHDLVEKSSALTMQTFEQIKKGEVRPNSYIVAFRNDGVSAKVGLHFKTFRQESRFYYRNLSKWHRSKSGIENIRYLGSLDMVKGFNQRKSSIPGPNSMHLNWTVDDSPDQIASLAAIDFSDKATAEVTLKKWLKEKRIYYAEPNYISKPGNAAIDEFITQFESTTPPPWISQINLLEAMQYLAQQDIRSKDIPIVAVMDSGVDRLHPELETNIYHNESNKGKLDCGIDEWGCNTTASGKGVLGNGDVFPAGTTGHNQSCKDARGVADNNCQHGTHVAGLVAGAVKEGRSGMCPFCRIMIVKVVKIDKKSGKSSFVIEDSAIIAGFHYVSRFTKSNAAGVRIINASFGKFQKSRSVELFIRALSNLDPGVIVIASAGNEDTMKRVYPAAYGDVMAVSNVKSDSEQPDKHPSSNFGRWVSIAAPGSGACSARGGGTDGLLATVPGNDTACLKGTSMASPVVAGVAGLVLANEPNLNINQLRNRLIGAAVPTKLYAKGINSSYYPTVDSSNIPIPLLGAGIIDAHLAVEPDARKNTPVISEALTRVSSACGILGVNGNSDLHWLFTLFLLPVFLPLLRKV